MVRDRKRCGFRRNCAILPALRRTHVHESPRRQHLCGRCRLGQSGKQDYKIFKAAQGAAHSILGNWALAENTPGIIKYPFWNMTHQNANATYACVNLSEADIPAEIKPQSIGVYGDIGDVLREMRRSGKHHAPANGRITPFPALPRASVASASVRRTPLSAKPNGPQPQAIV